MYNPSPEKCKVFIDAWRSSESVDEVFDKVYPLFRTKDHRSRHRIRRAVESNTGETLDPHNPQHSSEWDIICPSTLDHKKAKNAKRYVISSITNNSPLVKDFLTALQLFAEEKDAQLILVPVRYKNQNLMSREEEYFWPDEVVPYALTKDMLISNNLKLSATKIQATAANPLSGKLDLYKKKSFILGHPQLRMQPIGTPKYELPKKAMTTGSISRPRYSDSSAGVKARNKHSISALYVSDEGDLYRDFVMEWDGSGFHFFKERWTAEGKSEAKIAAIHFADVHSLLVKDEEVDERMQLVEELDPEQLIYNDLHDHGSQSHHLTTIEMMRNAERGIYKVEDEVQLSANIVNKLGAGRKNLIVQSNHHDHIDQWLNRFDPRKDPHNATYAFWLINECVKTGKTGLEIALSGKLDVKFEFVGRNKRKLVAGIDVSQHGDVGVNGARSAASLAKVGIKILIGHGHSGFINCDLWGSGVFNQAHGYAKGYGTWQKVDTIIYFGGARAHVNHINGSYWT